MDFDVGFFLCDIKQGHNITSDRFRMVTLLDQGRTLFDLFIQKCKQFFPNDFPAINQFNYKSKGKNIILAAARLKAISAAWEQVSCGRDAICIADRTVPNILPFAIVRQDHGKDTQICWFMPQATMQYGNPNETDLQYWNTRADRILANLLPLLSKALDSEIKSYSPLLRQLLYSFRMFRIGDESEYYGIEFLCKFCALEGIVTGSERSNKYKKIQERLCTLFKNVPHIDEIAKKLCEIRHDIAHEAKCDLFQWDKNYHAPEPLLEELSNLTRGILIYGIDHVDKCSSVEELWKMADEYNVDQCLLVKKCPGKEKVFTRYCQINIGVLDGTGKIFDDIFSMKMTT